MARIEYWQSRINNWLVRNFPDETVETATLGLVEEVGELCRAVLKRGQGIRGTNEEWTAEVAKELGDVFVKLVHVCEREGLSLETVISNRWFVVEKRDWTKDKVGHGMPDE